MSSVTTLLGGQGGAQSLQDLFRRHAPYLLPGVHAVLRSFR